MLNQLKAFTLLEAVISIAILGILLVIAVPHINEQVARKRLESVAQKLEDHLTLARSEALKRNADVYASFETGSSQWCYGFNEGSVCDCSSSTCSAQGLPDHIEIDSSDAGVALGALDTNVLYFRRGSGRASGSYTIGLSKNGETISIRINRAGKVSLCSNDIAGYPTC